MKPRVVYVSQFRDACGYAVAARGYLRAMENYLQNNPDSFDLKVYNINAENTSVKRLAHNEESIISKYEFWLLDGNTVYHFSPNNKKN